MEFETELRSLDTTASPRSTPPEPAPRNLKKSPDRDKPRSSRNRQTRPHVKNRDGVAVIIGNRDYVAPVPDVDFAYNDADEMKRFVIERLGFSEDNVIEIRDAVSSDLITVFGNSRTHKGRLWRWIRAGESDVVVFYSGHGVPGLQDRRGYLLPVNAEPDAPEINGYPIDLL